MQQPQGQAAEQTAAATGGQSASSLQAATTRPVCKQSTARQGGNKGLSVLHHHPVAWDLHAARAIESQKLWKL